MRSVRLPLHLPILITLLVVGACADPATAPDTSAPDVASVFTRTEQADASVRTLSSVRWNRKGQALHRARGGNPGRGNAYVSIAQYRAVLAALKVRHGSTRPSPAGAVAGASVVLLKQFYPLDAAAIDAELEAQRAEEPHGHARNLDFDAGEAIGRAIAAEVQALAATDNFGLTNPGAPPVGPGFWFSSGAPIVRGGLGARPFFLRSGNELRLPPPAAFGSATFLAALDEVRTIALTRTPEQVAITLKWVPFGNPIMNGIATDLIEKYHRSELAATAILAYGNAASFDAIIACFDTKFAYWYIRPTQADPSITLATPLPNHPSYPSAHSCDVGGFEEILRWAFPQERRLLDATATEAGRSRVFGGLHYQFDSDAGRALGRSVGRLAVWRRGLE